MDKFKGIAKGGWHPDSGQEGFRNQVGAVFGRKKEDPRLQHEATPISQLRDPSTFAPPPKRTAGGILPPPPRPSSSSPDTQASHQYGDQYAPQQPPAVEEPPPPPRPYRADTTGLSTTNLPPPPRRLDGAGGSSPGASPKPPPPSLPPRLPPRGNSVSPAATPPRVATPERQTGFLNQGAVDRLGAAGVSVPGLGVGGGSGSGGGGVKRPVLPPPGAGSSGVGGLQSRFGKLGMGGGEADSASPPPAQGTTWAQKQAALKTMSDFKKDPGSVSLADARSAASTANNFRQRHGDQVAAGVKTANGLDQKYGVSGKVGGYLGSSGTGHDITAESGTSSRAGAQSHLNTIGAVAGVIGKKKPPPPPPPKKKPDFGGGDAARDEDKPPPVPMSTRPTFS